MTATRASRRQDCWAASMSASAPVDRNTHLHAGSTIEFTQSAIVLESLINKFFANFASRGNASASEPKEEVKP